MTAARTHEIREAGPASVAAVSAPSSQPEPMIEPRDTNIRPQKPISLDRCPSGPWLVVLTVVAIVHPIVMPVRHPRPRSLGAPPPSLIVPTQRLTGAVCEIKR